jgi:RNA polymerase sigma-70 factor (ECF subfamily)
MVKTDHDTICTRSSLLVRLKDWHDESSWREFDHMYRPLIRNFALKQGLSESEAQDVVQETLLAVAKAIPDFCYDPARSTFKNWLLTVTRHRIADHFRKPQMLKGQLVLPDQTGCTPAVERVPDPTGHTLEADWDEEWKRHCVALALDRLKSQVKPKHFQMFYLLVLKEQPAASVAKALGVSRPMVYVAKHRVLPLFKKALTAARKELE